MRFLRPVSLAAAAATFALLLAGTTGASAEPTARALPASSSASAASGDDVVELSDAALDGAPRVELSGELLVLITEPPLDAPAEEHDHDDDLTTYSVVTDDGASVPISGDIPEDVETGDAFVGAVAVPQTVIDALPAASAAAVESSATAAPLAEETAAASDVLDAAVAQAAPLPVAEASVTGAPLARAGVAKAHELQIVVVNPAGVAASTVTDAALTTLAAQSTGFWTSHSRGLIPSFGTYSGIPRVASATPCNNNPTARWNEAAVALGYPNVDAYLNAAPASVEPHLLVVLPAGCYAASGPGVASVAPTLHYGGALQVVLGIGADRQVTTHELGHNLSLGHSNLDYCGATAASAGCTEYEYQDRYDVMGVSLSGNDAKVTTLNSRHQVALGFLTVPTQYRFDRAAGTPVTSTVTVGRLELGGASSVLEVVDPLTGQLYYVEYRAGEGSAYYAASNYGLDTGRAVAARPGVRLLRSSAKGGSSVVTQLDATLGAGYVRPFAAAGSSIQSPNGAVRIAVNSANTENATVTITLGTAPPVTAPPVSAPVGQPVYRFWSPVYNGHFYTISASERDSIIARYPGVWSYEGAQYTAFSTQVAGSVPLFRFWSPVFNGHFYTTNEAERDSVIARYPGTWAYEGVAYYVYPTTTSVPNTVTVARFWSETYKHHFYTASAAERDRTRGYPQAIWNYEGDAFRVPVG
jgi:hypothetical protein